MVKVTKGSEMWSMKRIVIKCGQIWPRGRELSNVVKAKQRCLVKAKESCKFWYIQQRVVKCGEGHGKLSYGVKAMESCLIWPRHWIVVKSG